MPGQVILYDQKIMARVPRDFPQLVSTAAARALISPSAYVRQALSEKLTRDGLLSRSDHQRSERQAEPQKAA